VVVVLNAATVAWSDTSVVPPVSFNVVVPRLMVPFTVLSIVSAF